jgi:hypothetical protein
VTQAAEGRQETGGLAPGGANDLEARLGALEALSTADLRIEWRRLYRAASPTRLSRDLLLRGVVYVVQERAQGGLSLTNRRRLRSLSEDGGWQGRPAAVPAITLKPGTKLLREWHGHTHTVSVLEGGFEYDGERYPSLSRIARRITGVHWSGPLFFGISKRRQSAVDDAADE